ncbi:MAG: SNF2-related protein [Arhodomonas sp.]|nr:SNF2-related protein [Arhodomonas sp.]
MPWCRGISSASPNNRFHLVVLDEAQAVKNPQAKTAQAVRRLTAHQRLCLTGTPLENHLGELWAQFDFLLPGLLGDRQSFNRLFRNPIEKQGDAGRQQALQQRIRPFLLRRTKQAIAQELPPKTEIQRRRRAHRGSAGSLRDRAPGHAPAGARGGRPSAGWTAARWWCSMPCSSSARSAATRDCSKHGGAPRACGAPPSWSY